MKHIISKDSATRLIANAIERSIDPLTGILVPERFAQAVIDLDDGGHIPDGTMLALIDWADEMLTPDNFLGFATTSAAPWIIARRLLDNPGTVQDVMLGLALGTEALQSLLRIRRGIYAVEWDALEESDLDRLGLRWGAA